MFFSVVCHPACLAFWSRAKNAFSSPPACLKSSVARFIEPRCSLITIECKCELEIQIVLMILFKSSHLRAASAHLHLHRSAIRAFVANFLQQATNVVYQTKQLKARVYPRIYSQSFISCMLLQFPYQVYLAHLETWNQHGVGAASRCKKQFGHGPFVIDPPNQGVIPPVNQDLD